MAQIAGVFEFKDYKTYLRARAKLARGELTKIAAAAGCQIAYLSRVLSDKIQLTPDHAFRLCRYWSFSVDEHEYFALLVEYERAADRDFRATLKEKLNGLREKNLDLRSLTNRHETLPGQEELLYHSHWAILSSHLLVAANIAQTPEKVAMRLGLPQLAIKGFLRLLMDLGLVKLDSGKYIATHEVRHLGRNSAALPLFLNQWRQRALLDTPFVRDGVLHYSNVQSISVSDYHTLLAMARNFAREATALATKSGDEDLFALNIDLFKP